MKERKLFLYNTLSRKVEEFKPLNGNHVKMYVCGITAYDSPHLGHIRSAVIYDVLYRVLKFLGYQVTYVRNVTDIDDKIIARSQKEGIFWKDLVKKYVKEYEEAVNKLGLLPPDIVPYATEHIGEIIEFIKGLIDKGFAYESEGNVYFEVRKFKEYGKLSGRKIEELRKGVRVDVAEGKKDPLDFALWKAWKEGEPFWESPWGRGRPGWHIECSAMSRKYLGDTIDIHGGGIDLIFPHHENEIAQSEALTGKPFVRFFVHHGLITINGEKMSKSLGNFVTIEYLLERFHPEVIKFFLLSKHYRSPLDYSEKAIKDVEKGVYRIYETLYYINQAKVEKEGLLSKKGRQIEKEITAFENLFLDPLLKDLNTAQSLGHFFALENKFYNFISGKPIISFEERNLLDSFLEIINTLVSPLCGVLQTPVEKFWQEEKERKLRGKNITLEEVEKLVKEREEARKEKNFEKADKIREDLLSKGIFLKDTPFGTFWYPES